MWAQVRRCVDSYEREVRDLPCFAYRSTVVVELYQVRCPERGIKREKVPLLRLKAPFSQRFEEGSPLLRSIPDRFAHFLCSRLLSERLSACHGSIAQ